MNRRIGTGKAFGVKTKQQLKKIDLRSNQGLKVMYIGLLFYIQMHVLKDLLVFGMLFVMVMHGTVRMLS